MVWGVPLLPLVIVGLLGALFMLWALQWLGLVAAAVVLVLWGALLAWMRLVSRADDQKIHQWLLRWRSTAARRNAAYWGTQAASPLEYRRSLEPR